MCNLFSPLALPGMSPLVKNYDLFEDLPLIEQALEGGISSGSSINTVNPLDKTEISLPSSSEIGAGIVAKTSQHAIESFHRRKKSAQSRRNLLVGSKSSSVRKTSQHAKKALPQMDKNNNELNSSTEKRKIRNREAAQQFRERQKIWVQGLENSVEQLMTENTVLKKENKMLMNHIIYLETFNISYLEPLSSQLKESTELIKHAVEKIQTEKKSQQKGNSS